MTKQFDNYADLITFTRASTGTALRHVGYGAELVTNGTFDTDTDWTKGTGWTISGGVATHTGAVGSNLTQSGILEIGAVYRITADLGNSFSVYCGSGSVLLNQQGSIDVLMVCSGNTNFYIRTASDGITADNISVREITPLAVSIQMEGTMTYADEDSIANVVFTSWLESASNFIDQRLATNGARLGGAYFLQADGGIIDTVIDAATGTYSPGINVPFNISSRHGSTFINGAVDGTALTENTTPTALPDLSTTDMQIGSTFMGTIKTLRVWADDLTDEGIAEASA